MRLFTDLRRGLLAATSLATLQVASPAYAQYAPYPQTAQPYTQPAQQQYAPAQQYAAPVAPPVAQQAMAPQQVAPSTPYQQYATAGQQVATQATQQFNAANQQTAQQFNAAAQQASHHATQQYDAATQYVASRPVATPSYAYPAAPVQTQPVAQPPVQYTQATPQQQPTAFQQVYPQGAPTTVSAAPYGPVYTARAMQTPAPEAVQNLPLTPPTEAVPPGASAANPQYTAPQPVPAHPQGYPAAGGYESYPSGYGANGGGCATGNCAPYGAADYSTFGCETPGTMDRLLCRNSCNYWFGGVYGLLMQRDSSDKYNLGMMDDTMPVSGYPTMPDVVLTSADVDPGYQGGVEFRLGRTFGIGGDPCGCGPCCPQWGVEGVYWEIFDNSQYDSFMPSMPRYYSMMPMPGLQYDGGGPGGYLPVNSYWDYGPPVDEPNTYEVTNARVRSNFQARNIELNLLRLNICGCAPACGPAMCDVGACSTCYTAPARYNITGVCGVRYLELDDNFMYGVDYTGGATGFLDYYSRTENRLLGFQLGSNAMYRIGCKWGVHMNTLVGLYGNDIETHQYFNSTTGMVRYASNGSPFDANASKTDVAMLGELRLGASYQATCNCRIYGGWRAMGLTGVALATNQAPNQWLTANQGGSYVNSSGSMILHGLQTGVEWNY